MFKFQFTDIGPLHKHVIKKRKIQYIDSQPCETSNYHTEGLDTSNSFSD